LGRPQEKKRKKVGGGNWRRKKNERREAPFETTRSLVVIPIIIARTRLDPRKVEKKEGPEKKGGDLQFARARPC